jgi:hypothetical protein
MKTTELVKAFGTLLDIAAKAFIATFAFMLVGYFGAAFILWDRLNSEVVTSPAMARLFLLFWILSFAAGVSIELVSRKKGDAA